MKLEGVKVECKWNSSLNKIDNHLNIYSQQEDNVFIFFLFLFWREYRLDYHCQKKRKYNRAKEKEAQHVEHWFGLSIIFIEVQYFIITLSHMSSSSTLHIPMNVWPYDVWVSPFFFLLSGSRGKGTWGTVLSWLYACRCPLLWVVSEADTEL